MNIYTLTAFILYTISVYAIGLYAYYQNTKNSHNTGVNYWVTAIGAQSSDMSSWLMLGFPATVYANGLFEAWTAIGLVFFMYLNWHYIAPRLRSMTPLLSEPTLSALFARTCNDTKGIVRTTSALICIIFFAFYIASGIVGMGRIFETIFDIHYQSGACIGLAIAIIYTLIGGFHAIAWSNVFQGIFLLITIIIVPLVGYTTLTGGIQTIISHAQQTHVSLSLWNSEKTFFDALLLASSWGLGYFGQPHILMYFMEINNPAELVYAKRVGIVWQIIALTCAIAVGIVGIGFFNRPPEPLDLLFVQMAQALLHPFVVGLVLCGILATVLTTMNGHILIIGSVISHDIYQQYINPQASNTEIKWVSRLSAFSLCMIALYIALGNNSSIYGLVNYAWSGLGSSFGPLLIASLYCSYIAPHIALLGLITSTCISALWPLYNGAIFPLIPAFFVHALILIIGISLQSTLFKARSTSHQSHQPKIKH